MRENLRITKIHQISGIYGNFTDPPGYSIFLKILLCDSNSTGHPLLSVAVSLQNVLVLVDIPDQFKTECRDTLALGSGGPETLHYMHYALCADSPTK